MTPLRFFADHCVPTTVIEGLRELGAEVLKLKDHMPPESSDLRVMAKAQELQAILVSLNGDFTDIINFHPSSFLGVVALQVRNRPEALPAVIERLSKFVSSHPSMDDYKGRLLLVEPHRIRIRS